MSNDLFLVNQLREKVFRLLERFPSCVHLRLLDTVPGSTRQPDTAKVDSYRIHARVGRSLAFDDFIDRNVRLSAVHGAKRQTALLQLALRVVPVLVQNEVLQTGEEADLTERPAVLEALVHVESAEESLEQISSVLRLQLSFRTGVKCVVRHAEIVANDCLGPVVD